MRTYVNKKTGKRISETEYQVIQEKKKMAKVMKRLKLTNTCFVTTLAILFFGVLLPTTIQANTGVEGFDIVEVKLKPNQTIWELVGELTPNTNPKTVILAMQKINKGMDLDNVKAYSETVTFYVDPSVEPSNIEDLNFIRE